MKKIHQSQNIQMTQKESANKSRQTANTQRNTQKQNNHPSSPKRRSQCQTGSTKHTHKTINWTKHTKKKTQKKKQKNKNKTKQNKKKQQKNPQKNRKYNGYNVSTYIWTKCQVRYMSTSTFSLSYMIVHCPPASLSIHIARRDTLIGLLECGSCPLSTLVAHDGRYTFQVAIIISRRFKKK